MAKIKRPGRFLWDGLNRGVGWLYGSVARSAPGRLMTGYRQADRAFGRCLRKNDRHSCHPMSPARLRLVESVESGRLFRGLRGLFRVLFACPTSFYALFALIYGLTGAGLYTTAYFVDAIPALPMRHLILSSLVALLSIPGLVGRKTLADTLGDGRFSRLVLVTFLGVPSDRLNHPRGKTSPLLPYLAILLGLCGGAGSYFIGPAVVPLGLLGLGLLGLVFTYPEAGVVLSTAFLPLIWVDRHAIWVLAALILLTWCSFGLKLLFLHRTAHMGLLDVAVLVFAAMLLLSGVTGAAITTETVLRGVLLFICLSDYLLIVNLMTTRAYVRRCLVGVVTSVVLVTLLSYLRLVPPESLGWMAGSPGGDLVVSFTESSLNLLSELWAEHAALYLVLVFPWLYAFLTYAKRLRYRVFWLTFVVLDLILVLLSGSVSALLCVVFGTVLFFLLLGPKWMSAGLVCLPAASVSAFWLVYLHPIEEATRLVLSRSMWYRSQLHDSLWQMVLDHPAGIGFGEECFTAVYPAYASAHLGGVTDFRSLWYEVLLGLGWTGLLIFIGMLFLFFQKSFTALRHTASSQDRAMVLGGIGGIAVTLVFGCVRSFISAPRVLFTVMLVIALCSAYENLLYDECDVLTAVDAGNPQKEDRLYRRG